MPKKPRYFPKPKQTALDRERSYRYMKQMWVSLHPAATPAEYDAAIAKMVKRNCGYEGQNHLRASRAS